MNMRPGSGRLNTGAVPGTGMRPGSGRRPPGTSRLRTGVVGTPSGAGTQAAQGVALNASINVTDRPMTGQGVMGMRTAGGGGRLVEDTSYYVGLLRRKMTEVNRETQRLKDELDQSSKDSSQTTALEQKYDKLLKQKELLEGQLADYNLAMDKTRTSTDPQDVQSLAMHMAEKNRQTGQELDRVFMQRKNRESDTGQIEEQIESIYKTIQNRINDLEPDKLKTYNDLHNRQRELGERCVHNENKLQEINNRIRNLESDDKSGAHRKEFANLERVYQSLKKDATSLQEELDIASLDPKEAHTEFVNRVNNFKADTKALTDKCNSLREENGLARRSLDEMDNADQDDDGDQAKYELLVQRDKEMTAFMDKFDDTRNALIAEQGQIKEMNVALLEHISKGIEDSNNMPSQDIMNEMDSTKSFKERNLATQKQTLEDLQVQRKKREKELELMEQSEPKMANDLEQYKERMLSMKQEMKEFEDIKGLREAFEGTKQQLVELRMSYQKRRDAMRQQVQAASVEHEAAKRALTNNDTARELDDTEKRLKHYERTIFEIKEFVTNKSKETDFDAVKGQCLKVLETLNLDSIRKAQNAPSMNQAQAKY